MTKHLLLHINPGLDPTKKSQKISGLLSKFSVFGYCNPSKNYWLLFSEIWPASYTKKLDPIFSDLSKKLRVRNFQIYLKKIGSEFFLLVGLSPFILHKKNSLALRSLFMRMYIPKLGMVKRDSVYISMNVQMYQSSLHGVQPCIYRPFDMTLY